MLIDAMDCLTNIQQFILNKEDSIYQLRIAVEQNDKKLADCLLLVQTHHNIPEELLIKAIGKLEDEFIDSSIILKLLSTCLDNCYCNSVSYPLDVNLAKHQADYINRNKLPKKRGEILYEKLLSQFCYDYNVGHEFYQSYIDFESSILKDANEKDRYYELQIRKQLETNIKQLYQRVLKMPIKNIEQFWQQYKLLETNQLELEKQEKIFLSTQERIHSVLSLQKLFDQVSKSEQLEEISIFFNLIEEELKKQNIEFPKFLNFYDIFFFVNPNQVSLVKDKYIDIIKTQSNPHILSKQLTKLLRICDQSYEVYLLHLRTLEQINKDDEEFEVQYLLTHKYVKNVDQFNFSLEYIYRYTRQYLQLTEQIPEQQQKIRNLFSKLYDSEGLAPQQKAKVYYDLAKIESLLFDNKLNARSNFEKCLLLDCDNFNFWRDYFQSQISIPIGTITQRDRLRGILKRAVEVCKEDRLQSVEDWLNFELLFGTIEEVYKAEERMRKSLLMEQQGGEQEEKEEEEESENIDQVPINDGIYGKHNEEQEKAPQVFVDSSKTVFVKNLPKELNEQDLIALLPESTVLECRIVKDRNKISKGFAYVDFTDEQDAQQAVNILQNKIIKGEKLYAAISKPPKLYQEDRLTLYVDNLAYSVTEEKLKEKAGQGIVEIRIVKDENGRPRGYAYIQYMDEPSKASGFESLNSDPYIDGRKYFVKLSDSLEKIKQNQQNHSVFIRNLPFKIREIEIRQLFDGMNIVQINIPKNNDGKPKGFAFVEFEKSKHLKLALDMNGIDFKGRLIEIIKSERKITYKKEEKMETQLEKNFRPKSNSDFKELFKR